jgi:hypothetical protein
MALHPSGLQVDGLVGVLPRFGEKSHVEIGGGAIGVEDMIRRIEDERLAVETDSKIEVAVGESGIAQFLEFCGNLAIQTPTRHRTPIRSCHSGNLIGSESKDDPRALKSLDRIWHIHRRIRSARELRMKLSKSGSGCASRESTLVVRQTRNCLTGLGSQWRLATNPK